MSDLVKRLRDPRGFDWGDFYALTMEAADRVEALEKERDALVKERNRLRDVLKEMEYQDNGADCRAIARAALGGEE